MEQTAPRACCIGGWRSQRRLRRNRQRRCWSAASYKQVLFHSSSDACHTTCSSCSLPRTGSSCSQFLTDSRSTCTRWRRRWSLWWGHIKRLRSIELCSLAGWLWGCRDAPKLLIEELTEREHYQSCRQSTASHIPEHIHTRLLVKQTKKLTWVRR